MRNLFYPRLTAKSRLSVLVVAVALTGVVAANGAPPQRHFTTRPSTQAGAGAKAPKENAMRIENKSDLVTFAQVGACKVGATCEATLRIEVKSPYHVNEEYPNRLVFEAEGPAVKFLHQVSGSNPSETFSKTSGDFTVSSKSVGVFQVRFQVMPKASKVTLRGTVKFGICAANACLPRSEKVSLEIPIG